MLFTSAARKAWAGAAISFLGPLSVLLLATDQPLTLRTVLASVVAGLIGGFTVFQVPNKVTPLAAPRPRSRRGRHYAEENSSPHDGGVY